MIGDWAEESIMLVERSYECLEKLCWLSTLVSTNDSHEGPAGAYEMTRHMASELRKHTYSIL
jgi:hypothetical protein